MVAWSALVTTDDFKIAVLHQAFSWLLEINWKVQVVDYFLLFFLKKKKACSSLFQSCKNDYSSVRQEKISWT